jgi:hypothetical protein
MVIYSIAPNYKNPQDVDGHWSILQERLKVAANLENVNFFILAPCDAAASDSVLRVLRENSVDGVSQAIQDILSADSSADKYVFIYEGSIHLLEVLRPVFRRFANVKFVINLFGQENFMSTPAPKNIYRNTLAAELRRRRTSDQIQLDDWPDNLSIVAETPQKLLMAKGIGLPVRGVWPGMLINKIEPQAPRASWAIEGKSFNIVIPLSKDQMDFRSYRQIVKISRRFSGINFDDKTVKLQLIIQEHDLSFRKRIFGKLLRRKISFGENVEGQDSYIRYLESASLVWIPYGVRYMSNSSGKVLEALGVGKPVLMEAGTFGDRIMQSWSPGFPTYRGTGELFQVLATIPIWFPVAADEIHANRDQIVSQFSPRVCLEFIIRLGSVEESRSGESIRNRISEHKFILARETQMKLAVLLRVRPSSILHFIKRNGADG